jgi:hypothetical protein
MGLGILEDHKLEHVPGTAFVLEDDRRREEEQVVTRDANLKYDKTGKILLVPQPSDDPNDPLVRTRPFVSTSQDFPFLFSIWD